VLPTFIIAGAGKSGTTTLWEHLKAHPEVSLAVLKEPCFFTKDSELSTFSNGISWYQDLFPEIPGAKAFGEASTIYMVSEDSPALIFETVPVVKLIFILRDPVERLYSQFFSQQKQQGLQLPEFEDMIRECHPMIQRLIYASSYQIHLTRYLGLFPLNQIKVIIFDDLKSDPKTVVHGIYEYIGVDPGFVPSNIGMIYNAPRQLNIIWLQHWIWKIGLRIMRMGLNPQVLSYLQKLRTFVFRVNSKKLQRIPMSRETRELLLLEFRETITFMEKFLERPLPQWRRV
jgi:hypothetical protein